MSDDMSSPLGSGLDTTVRPAERATQGTPASAEPSLARVLGTTLHLWVRRRVLRVPDGVRAGALRWAALTVGVLVIAGGATGLVAGLSGGKNLTPRPQQHHHAPPPPNPAIALTAAHERMASAWIVTQVAAGTPVGCDATMCGYLQAAGMASTQQVLLQPGASLPGAGAVIVTTPAVRSQATDLLAGHASGVLATFGTGQDEVQVLVATSETPAGYLAAVRREVTTDAMAGRALAKRPRLHLSAGAGRELVSGRVDPRLLYVIARLAAPRPVYVTGFGDIGPGAGWPALLRSVTIGRLVHGSGRHRVSEVASVLGLLRGLRAPYRAAISEQRLADGQIMLTVEFPVPSPL